MKTPLFFLVLSLILPCTITVRAGETGAPVAKATSTNITTAVVSTNGTKSDLITSELSSRTITRVAGHIEKSPKKGWSLARDWKFGSVRSESPKARLHERADYAIMKVGVGTLNTTFWSSSPLTSIGPEVGYIAVGVSGSMTLK